MSSALLVTLLLHLPCARAAEADPDAPQAIQASLERMRAASARLHSATYTLHRREWQGGDALPAQVMEIKLRRPEDLYMRWTGEAYRGRELLYRPGWNQGRLRISEGAFIPTVDLDPQGAIAMHGARHPAWMASVLRTSRQILAGADVLSADPDLNASYLDLGTVAVEGQPSHCYQADLPVDRDPQQYAHRVLVCMSTAHGLPTRFAAWERVGGELRQIEDYVFVGLVVNPGLDDAAFDPDNPGYGF
jgi:hypothetical protein